MKKFEKDIKKELKEIMKEEIQLGNAFGIYNDITIEIIDDKVHIYSKSNNEDIICELVSIALLKFLGNNKDMLDCQVLSLYKTLECFQKMIEIRGLKDGDLNNE